MAYNAHFRVKMANIAIRWIMARAKRHYIPGQIWHLTHRRHKQEFLLKLVRVGNSSFIERIRKQLGILAGGRKIFEKNGGLQLREEVKPYMPILMPKWTI